MTIVGRRNLDPSPSSAFKEGLVPAAGDHSVCSARALVPGREQELADGYRRVEREPTVTWLRWAPNAGAVTGAERVGKRLDCRHQRAQVLCAAALPVTLFGTASAFRRSSVATSL